MNIYIPKHVCVYAYTYKFSTYSCTYKLTTKHNSRLILKGRKRAIRLASLLESRTSRWRGGGEGHIHNCGP